MFNVQMKLKINEREATAFWIMFIGGDLGLEVGEIAMLKGLSLQKIVYCLT